MLRSFVVLSATVLGPACAADRSLELPAPCTQAGADEGLDVRIAVTGGTLAPDVYTITVDADGQAPRFMFPLQQGLGSGGHDEVVTADGRHLYIEGWLDATDGEVQVEYAEGGGPADLSIEIANRAGVLAHADFTPSYQLDEPNGPDCLPHAHNASATMTITP